jgi:hypothetical protein
MIVPQTDTGRWAENAQALRQLSLSHSAKAPRNFGKRGVYGVIKIAFIDFNKEAQSTV